MNNTWIVSFYNGKAVSEVALYVRPEHGWYNPVQQIANELINRGYWLRSKPDHYTVTTQRDDRIILHSDMIGEYHEIPLWIMAVKCDYDVPYTVCDI